MIVWPTLDTNPTPPPEIKARFPDLVPEVPRDGVQKWGGGGFGGRCAGGCRRY